MLEKGIVERVKNFKCVFFYIECLEDHPVLLDKVLSQVEEDGPKARRHKWSFAQSSVYVLGYRISEDLISLCVRRIPGLLDSTQPIKKSQVRKLLGRLVMRRRFGSSITHRSAFLHPLTNSFNRRLREQYTWEFEDKRRICYGTGPSPISRCRHGGLVPRNVVGFPLVVLPPPQRQCACPYGVATVELTQAEIRSGDIFKNEVKC